MWENWGFLEKHEETVKTKTGSSTGNPDKRCTKIGQNGKRERSWNMWEDNGKDNTRKNISTNCGNKREISGERREIKEISTKDKTIHTKQDIPKQRKKILSTTGRAWQKTYQQPDAKETEQFWTKIWQPKKHNEKA